MKVKKGQAGYIRAKKKKYGIQSLIGFGIVAAILFFGIWQTGTKLNLFTVFAILGCLPSAKFLVEFITMFPYKSVDQEIVNDIKTKAPKMAAAYDLIITSRDSVMPVDAIVVSGQKVMGYTSNKKTDVNEVAEHMKSTLAQNGISKATVKVFSDYAMFISRAEGLNSMVAVDGSRNKKQEFKIRRIIMTLAM